MKELFKSTKKVNFEIYNRVPIEVIEKEFILGFFKELPIEYLKMLIDFKTINPLFENLSDSQRLKEKHTELIRLNCVELSCELWLDNGIEDLSLGQI